MAKKRTKAVKEIVLIDDVALYVDGELIGDEDGWPPAGADLLRACGLRVRAIQNYGLSPHDPPKKFADYLRYSKVKAQWDKARAELGEGEGELSPTPAEWS